MMWRMMGFFALLALLAGSAPTAHAVVMCAPKAKKTGVLKEGAPIKLRTACKPTEVGVDPAALGLRGPVGQDGADGQDGEDGAPGLSGVEIVVANGATVVQLSNGTGSATASCPAGKKVLGGGIEIVEDVGDLSTVTKIESYPVTAVPQGWSGLVRGNSTEDWHLRVYAICANAS